MENWFKKDSSLYSSAIISCLCLIGVFVSIVIANEDVLFSLGELIFAMGLIITCAVSFKKAKKEIVKATTACILAALAFLGLLMVIELIAELINGSIAMPLISSILLIIEFSLLVAVFIVHLVINSTNNSMDKWVRINKILIFILMVFNCYDLISYIVLMVTETFTSWLYIFECIMTVFVLNFVGCIETRVNMFRTMREDGIKVD